MENRKTNPIQAIRDAVLAAAPGLTDIGPDLAATFKQQATQTSMELASLLFNGNAFVQYGPGQHAPEADRGQDTSHDRQHENEGMER